MSAPAEIIERIKKLLRLARSSNPHEAQLAMERAMQLAREHEIAVEGLNPDEAAREKVVTHRDTEEHLRVSYDKEYAVRICCRFFHVKAIFVKVIVNRRGWPEIGTKITFVGRRSDLEIAFYVYHFLQQHFGFCWRKHRGRLRNRHAFVDGMFEGIYSRLQEAEAPRDAKGTELVLRELETYISAVIGDTTKRDFRAPDHNAMAARSAGWVAGRQTNIRTPLNAGADETLALK